ncbi:hypothetical protein [Caballeronia sordidicola]|uniref:hypothetical protein n=1 Tax=Caballeronia sordidicola TaxID=196367 RepID=UPI000A885635|nr:hypothetical protein [Caballeronia sordidicola]
MVEQRTTVKHDAACKLRAECFEPAAAAWTGERDGLYKEFSISQGLTDGFEV